jgi:hypothetical protein
MMFMLVISFDILDSEEIEVIVSENHDPFHSQAKIPPHCGTGRPGVDRSSMQIDDLPSDPGDPLIDIALPNGHPLRGVQCLKTG